MLNPRPDEAAARVLATLPFSFGIFLGAVSGAQRLVDAQRLLDAPEDEEALKII